LGVFALFAGSSAAFAWESKLVKMVNGKLTYAAVDDPAENKMPDFSNAGYRGANYEIPDVTVLVDTVNSTMSAATINAIIEAAGNKIAQTGTPGYVLFKAGTYTLNTAIVVKKPNIVLRGEGAEGAVILVAPENSHALKVDGNTTKPGDDRYEWDEVLAGTESVPLKPGKVPAGSRTFQISPDAVGQFKVKDAIILERPITTAWVTAIDKGGFWPFQSTANPDGSTSYKFGGPGTIRYHRYITHIAEATGTITIDAPVFYPLDSAYGRACNVYKPGRPSVVQNVGLENLTILGKPKAVLDPRTGKTEVPEFNTVYLSQVENCWVRGVTVKRFSRAGICLSEGTSRCTVIDCKALEPSGPQDGGYWYNFCVERAQLILFEKCVTTTSRHAFIANGGTSDSGIVVLECTMNDVRSPSEMHRNWGQGMLFDSCKAVNPGNVGVIQFYNRGDAGIDKTKPRSVSNAGHGWAAANCVIWRCDAGGTGSFKVSRPATSMNYAIGTYNGTITDGASNGQPTGYVEGHNVAGLTPVSLYRQQLLDRTPDPVPYEAETLTPTAFGGDLNKALADTGASGGVIVLLSNAANGSYVEFTLPNVAAGTYWLSLDYFARASRGIVGLSVNGTPRGTPLDQYSATDKRATRSFGRITQTQTGNLVLRLTVQGKNASATDDKVSADKFTLTQQLD
jgi:hypothetical protein